MPSWKSSVRRSQSCSTSSRSVAASTASISPRRTVSRVASTASGDDCAISSARACAALRTSACGTSWSARPIRTASVAGDAAAGIEQQRRLLRPDEARQGRGQAEAGVKAEPVEIGAEPRLLAGDAEIGDEREAEPAADRGAVDRADNRLLRAEQADRLLVEMPSGAAAAAFLHRAGIHALREIGAGAETSGPRRRARSCGTPGRRRCRSNASPISAISAASKKLCGGRRISTVATRPSRLTPISLKPV